MSPDSDMQQLSLHILLSTGKAINSTIDIHQPPQQMTEHAQYLHLRHTADILTRQATEVAQLKTELDGTRTRCAREVAELRERLRQVEAEKVEGMANLTAKLGTVENRHKTQLEDLQTVHSRESTRLQHKVTDLVQSLQNCEATKKSIVTDLQNTLATSKLQHAQDMASLKEELRCKAEEANSLSSLVSQLRTYIGESRQDVQAVSEWQQHKAILERRITELIKECESLQSTIQLMNIRLSSTNEILTIQESEVAQAKIEGVDPSKMKHGLLARWREKVFAQMVQQKSQDIMLQKDTKQQQNFITELDNKVVSAQNQCLMLEHSIADKEAQLQMERDKYQSLEEELHTLRQVTNAMDAKLQSDEEAVLTLHPLLNSFKDWCCSYKDRTQVMVTKLGAFERRMHFATSRIDVLKGLFARKEALLKIHLSQKQETQANKGEINLPGCVQPDNIQIIQDSVERMSYDELLTELGRVRLERDRLADKIKEDAVFFEKMLQTTKQKLESKLGEMEEKSRSFESLTREKCQQIQSLKSELEEQNGTLLESTDTISRLKVNIAKLQVGADKASKERCGEIEHQYTSQLTQMEQRLNEARREHAKAVVSLRQLERQNVREKVRAAETLQLQEERRKVEVGKLTNRLRDVEKDRNLYMAILRQEGLIAQCKSQRPAAKEMPDSKASSDLTSVHQSVPSSQYTPAVAGAMRITSIQQKGSLSVMLDDIRTLTEHVLYDEEEEQKDKEDG